MYWDIHSTYHMVITSTPGVDIFGSAILFDIPYVADWNDLGRCRQDHAKKDIKRENSCGLPQV